MATILTVHGTGSTGPETGEQWWQKGSEFEGRMRRLVEPEEGAAGELTFQPVIWDGANSETSRRAAGTELCGKMNELEARGEPYSIIGHSHGGSVISAALINHAGKRCTLDHLKNWITVGTPFIQSRKERFLFSRLGLIGKVIYGIFLGLSLILVAPWVQSTLIGLFSGNLTSWNSLWGLLLIVVICLILFIPFFGFYYVSRKMERDKTLRYSGNVKKFLANKFSSRLISLWHKNDEAIQGLGALQALQFDIFAKDFAARKIKTTLLFSLPLLLTALVLSPGLMRSLFEATKAYEYSHLELRKYKDNPERSTTRKLLGNGKNYSANFEYIYNISLYPIENGACNLVMPNASCNGLLGFVIRKIPTVFLLFGLFVVVSKIFEFAAGPFSWGLARMLNPIARSQIRASAFGADTQVDAAVDVRSWPMWMERGQPALPDELANEIQAHADKAAALAIPKFRNAARLFASSADDTNFGGANSKAPGSTDMLSEYLTWDELIHTSYFTNQRFCKLVAYALTQNGGLRATAAFKADPDYALVAKWHKGLAVLDEAETSAGAAYN